MPKTDGHRIQGHLAMLLFSMIVAGSFSFGKLIAFDVHPGVLTTLRFGGAAMVLAVAFIVTGRFRATHYRAPWRFAVLGGCFALFFVLMFFALRLTSSLSTAAIFTIMPLAAAILDRVLFGRGSRAMVWLGLTLGALGALWVVFDASPAAAMRLSLGRGEILFFCGMLAHALYVVLVPRLRRGEPLFATTLGVCAAASGGLAISFASEIKATVWADQSPLFWGMVIYLSMLATLGTFALVTYATERLSSAKVTAYTFAVPFWVVCLDSVIGHAPNNPMVLWGGLPIAMGLCVLYLDP